MANKFDMEQHAKQILYTSGWLAVSLSGILLTYHQVKNKNYDIAFVLFFVSGFILIIVIMLIYRLITNTDLKKPNTFQSYNTGRSTNFNLFSIRKNNAKKSKTRKLGFVLSNVIKTSSTKPIYQAESALRIDHLDYLFYTEIDGSEKCFAGWILWEFLHEGEWKQIQIDDEYQTKKGKPPGAFSRQTWLNIKWHGKQYRYNFTWSKKNWAMVYKTLKDGVILFHQATGLMIATGLNEGETLRLSRGAGYVYEAVATSLLNEWNWLKEIRMAPELLRTGHGRSSLVNRFIN